MCATIDRQTPFQETTDVYDTVVPLMPCTACHQELAISLIRQTSAADEIVEGEVTCASGHVWPVEHAVLVFTGEDAPSDPGSNSYADYGKYYRDPAQVIPQCSRDVAPVMATCHRPQLCEYSNSFAGRY
jgi:hypothetical protein